jgi:hypothetical protein
VLAVISISWLEKPTLEITKVKGGGVLTVKEKFPSASVMVPVTVPFIEMLTPANDSPLVSVTFPETVVCAQLRVQMLIIKTSISKSFLGKKCFINFLEFLIFGSNAKEKNNLKIKKNLQILI